MRPTTLDRPFLADRSAERRIVAPAAPRSGARRTARSWLARQGCVLVTAPALSSPEVALLNDEGARIIVAGDSAIAMSLAELALPGATRIWCNLRQSADLRRLQTEAEAEGPVDRLILAAAGPAPAETLALMRVVLAFLPGMRARGQGKITLVAADAAAAAALASFVGGLRPALAGSEIVLDLRAG